MAKLMGTLLLLPLLTACGQIAPFGARSRFQTETDEFRTLSVLRNDSTSCRYNDAITPDHDRWLDGSGYYSVCASSEDEAVITIHGQAPEGAKQYCVFPAQVAENGSIYPKLNEQGLPMVKCSSLQDGPQAFKFEYTNYNAAFITAHTARNQMQACLGSGSYFDCPDFSYGQFR